MIEAARALQRHADGTRLHTTKRNGNRRSVSHTFQLVKIIRRLETTPSARLRSSPAMFHGNTMRSSCNDLTIDTVSVPTAPIEPTEIHPVAACSDGWIRIHVR